MEKENKFRLLLRKALYISPSCLQGAVSFFYLNYGLPLSIQPIRYLKFYKFLKESQWWPKWKLEQYQIEKLKPLLRHAYDNIPYYTDVFKKINLTPDDIMSIEDLRKLPVLTKESVAKNFDKLVYRKNNKRHLKLTTTSGSTGKPMQFYCDKRDYSIEHAFIRRYTDWMSVKMDDRTVKLWSRPFIEKEIKDIFLYEPHWRRLSLSTAQCAKDSFSRYIELIRWFNPDWVMGNPSFLFLLACYMQERDINSIKFKCFFSYFENLFTYQRELIEKQFNCKVFNYYACEERVISAMECSKREGMHIEMERGIIELVGDKGEPLPEGSQGRILATGLHNYTMPLIRYDIGDIGSISKESCSCGRGLPLLKSFDGRANEVIRYKDKLVYSTTLSVLLWQFKNIKESQFIQESEDEIKVNIVRRMGYSENDTQELINTLKKMTDEKLNITINFIDYIPRTKMGKFPFVVSKVSKVKSDA